MMSHNVNGIDPAALAETIEAFADDPSLAVFNFRARNHWVNGGASSTEIDDYFGVCEERRRERSFHLRSDEPQVLFGGDAAPNALEYLLHAMASCIATTFMLLATRHDISVSGLETRLEGEIDLRGLLGLSPDVPKGFSRIDVQMVVRSAADPDNVREICELAWKQSPVFDVVTRGVPVSITPLIETVSL